MALCAVFGLSAAEHHGEVKFGGLPLPGATITAKQGDKTLVAISDSQGVYSFPDLPAGTWSFEVEMLCFATIKQDVPIGSDAAIPDWDMKLLPLKEIEESAGPVAPPPPPTPAVTTTAETAPPPASSKKSRGSKSAAQATPANPQSGFQRTDVKAAAPANGSTPAQAETTPPASDNFGNQGSADLNQRASDGLLINGASNNGASSPFALAPAFGNNRRGPGSLYNGSIGVIENNSVFDARSFSLTGQDTPKPYINNLTGVLAFGGPLRIPHLIRNGPNFFVNYQWNRTRNAVTQTGLVPTAAERTGDFSQTLGPTGQPLQIFDPVTGMPIAGNVIPANRLNPQAQSLLNLYPLPNFVGSTSYNYQIPVVDVTHQDSLQSRVNKTIGRKNQLSGLFAFQSTRSDTPNILGFLDTTDSLGINSNITWRHTFTPRMYGTFTYQYSRFAARITPFFENRENVSGQAGISGNNQQPVNWGPPTLSFSDGTQAVTDQQASHDRNQTGNVSAGMLWYHNRHNVSFGGDYRRQGFNDLSQQDARGTFNFTGAATQQIVNGVPVPGTGDALADFLYGVPDTSSIAFGNADKYFRESVYDAYVTDDWRLSPGLTINVGMRWEYGAPMTELYGRLVNLDVAPEFSAVAAVVASDPVGPLTQQHYPDSLVRPDKHAFEPRLALSWRPFAASSMVVRAGYGVYYNTSVYQSIATEMAQQSPLSKSLSVENSPADPLTLANGFNAAPLSVPNTFAIDPNFRIGYSQNWQASVQRDLPASLMMTATYLGIKGTRGVQEFYPNTYPIGAADPCPTCPSGFAYLTSNGNSTREAGTFQLRRRLHNGFTASAQYTYSKSIDDSALGGKGQASMFAAQNWLDLSADRGLSNFDQRHLATIQAQYTSGMGAGGGTLMSGWRGALLKEWTVVTQITLGSGLPLNPVYLEAVPGTGFTGSIRPDATGLSVYNAPPGLSLNPNAYTAPAAGQWGTAGRNSITGPSQFSLNASMGRTFRLTDRLTFDLRIDANNALNHVTFANWITTVNNPQFGLPGPASANAMRSVLTTMRVRF